MSPRSAVFRGCRAAFALGLVLAAGVPFSAGAVTITSGAPVGATQTAQVWRPATGELPLEMTVALQSKNPRAGEPVRVDVTVRANPGVDVTGPAYDLTLGDWAVQKAKAGRSRKLQGRSTRTDELTLLTYMDGTVEVPALTLRFRLADGRSGEYRSAPVSIPVAPPAAPNGDWRKLVRGLKPQIGLFPWLGALLALLTLTGVSAAIWLYARKRNWVGPLVPPAPPRPPAEVARERLAALRASGLLAAGDGKTYYSELSDILRRYLEGRFGIAALDRTTQELTREMKGAALARQDILTVREILEHSDMAKFAKARPSTQEADGDWQAVAELIDRTAPCPEAPAAEARA